MVKKLFLVLTVMAVALTSCESPMMEDMTATPELAANKEKKPKKPKKLLVAQLDVEAAENSSETRAYDADLVWHWEYGDALKGYQVAYDNIRNRVAYDPATGLFSCADFTYQSSSPECFHFIYPSGAEVENGVLKAVQDGVWRPVSVFTTGATKIDALPKLQFEQLSSALELRIWSNENNAMQQQVVSAVLTADSDFVGRWTLDPETMTYAQDLNGKEIVINDINKPAFQVNMPHLPEGYGDDVEIKLVLTRADGRTCTTYLPQELTYVKQKRTIYNLIFVPDPAFTCATYNVDGLPDLFGLNDDGPAESGTQTISENIAASGWDFVAFQENFSYDSYLKSHMSAKYTFGKFRKLDLGQLTIWGLGQIAGYNIPLDTDGLGFATLNSTCRFTSEYMWAFKNKLGGIKKEQDGGGANTMLKKGIRHYVVEMKDGAVFDVLITHMNTADTPEQIAVQDLQLQEVAAYINEISVNKRPIIFMGDMNTRYTRNDYQTYFWSKLHSGLEYADPWVEFMWGDYPTYPSDSIMTGDWGMQYGEVVDKIIYINNPDAEYRITAKNYLHDESFNFVSDHNPVVVQFGYEKVK